MLKELQLWWRLRPIISKLKGLLAMKLSVNSAIQILALLAQGLNQIVDLVSPKGKFWVMVGLSAIQGISGVLAHFSNPDGTPAEAPYIKP